MLLFSIKALNKAAFSRVHASDTPQHSVVTGEQHEQQVHVYISLDFTALGSNWFSNAAFSLTF